MATPYTRIVDSAGTLRKFWDDATDTYFEYGPTGTQTLSRAYNPGEIADKAARVLASTADSNASTIKSQVAAAITANKAYVANQTPTTAQTTAQVKALSRQVNGVMRLLTGQLDATD
jgi:hypothetical protein